MSLFVTKVEIDTESGQLSLLFPPNFLEALKLVDGEFLIWDIQEDQIVLKKKTENNINNT